MSFRRLIFIGIIAIGLLPMTNVWATEEFHCIPESVSRTNDRPQWSDLGMDHALAVNGQSNVTSPSATRLVNNGRRVQNGNGPFSGVNLSASDSWLCHYYGVHGRMSLRVVGTQGLIYVIECLRL